MAGRYPDLEGSFSYKAAKHTDGRFDFDLFCGGGGALAEVTANTFFTGRVVVEGDMERLREVFTYAAAALGLFALLLAIYNGATGRGAVASFIIIFSLCLMVVFISQIKAFRVWEIEVQLADRLNQADLLLKQVQQSAVINAKAAYLNLTKTGRWSSPDMTGKQAMLDEIQDQLKSLKVSDNERNALATEYIRIAGFDFYMMFINTMQRYVQFKENRMVSDVGKNPGDETFAADVARWRNGKANFKPNYNLFETLDTYSLSDELNRLDFSWMSAAEQKAVETYKNQILSLYKSSQERHGLTKEAAAYYDKYADLGGQDKKLIELFGFNPSELH